MTQVKLLVVKKPNSNSPPSFEETFQKKLSTVVDSKISSIRERRHLDLDQAVKAQGLLTDKLSSVLQRLKFTMDAASSLDDKTRPNSKSRFFSELNKDFRDISDVIKVSEKKINMIIKRSSDRINGKEKEEEEYLKLHSKVCEAMESLVFELNEAGQLADRLHKRSSTGFNVEVRLSKRLRTSDILRTLSAAQNQVKRSLSLARASSNSPIFAVRELINNSGR